MTVEKELPTKTDLTYNMFQLQMENLATYLQIEISKKILRDDYWPVVRHYNNKRFADVVNFLKENYEYKRFPRLSDIKKGYDTTRPPENNYKPLEDKIDRMAYQKDIRALVEKFRIPEDKSKKLPKQKEMYIQKLKDGLVFSYEHNKWVDRSLMNNIGGSFLLPEWRKYNGC